MFDLAVVRRVRGILRIKVLEAREHQNPSAGVTCHSLTENEAGMDMPQAWEVRRRVLPYWNPDASRLILRYPPDDAQLLAHRLRKMADAVERLGRRQGVL